MAIPIRNSVLQRLYTRPYQQNDKFDWDKLTHAPISYYLTEPEVTYINNIAVSAQYGGIGVKRKIDMLNAVLKPKGFILMATGTNRVVYRCDYDQSFVLKIGFDRVGVEDSKREYQNQLVLKPFVPKIFDVSPGGTIGLIERVEPILNKHQFINVADQVFDVLNQKILGKYVLEDIGTKFFKNWGLREGFGPVLLDFPYLYEIDGSKLICNAEISKGVYCDGYIDYDDGFNYLICEKCGQRHSARSLGKANGATMVTQLTANLRRKNKMIGEAVMTLVVDGKEYGVKKQPDKTPTDKFVRNRPNYWNGFGLKNVLVVEKKDGTKEIKGNIPNNAPPSMVLHDGFFIEKDRLERKKNREELRLRREEQGRKYDFTSKKKDKIPYQKPVVIDEPPPKKEEEKESVQVNMVVDDGAPTMPPIQTRIRTTNLTDTEKDRLSIGFQGKKNNTDPEIILEPEVIADPVPQEVENIDGDVAPEPVIDAEFTEPAPVPTPPVVEEIKPDPDPEPEVEETKASEFDLADFAKNYIKFNEELYIRFEVIQDVIPFDKETIDVIEKAATKIEAVKVEQQPIEEKKEEPAEETKPVPDFSSAADRTKLNEVLMDESEIFLEAIGEDDIKSLAQKDELEIYLFNQLIMRYSQSDKDMLKQIVKNFVDEIYDDSILKEAEKTAKERKAENRKYRSEDARKRARTQF